MSVVPEYVLQSTIVRGITRLRTDYRLIAQLFRNLDQKSTSQIVKFIKDNMFDLAINYPRTTLKVPAIVILLKNESEEQAFLGDSMGIEFPDEFSFDGPVLDGQVFGVASTSSLSGNPKLVFGPFTGFTGTRNTLRIATQEWVVDQFVVIPHQVRIVQGTGVGQIRDLTGNSRDTLMVKDDWKIIPDNTTVFEIVTPPDEVLGEPSSLYDRQNYPFQLERRGGLYNLNYQIQVIGPSQELAIYLTIILKGIFTLFRTFMESQGVINFRLSATDFAPRPEYLPDIAYMRAMNMEFVFPFDIFEPFQDVARSFHLQLEGEPADGSISVPPVFSDTSWQLTPQPIPPGGSPVVNPLTDVQRVYFGSAVPPMVYDANFVQNTLGGQGTAIASGRQMVVNFFTGPGQKMFYAIPNRFSGDAGNFIDSATGLPVGFSIAATLPITTSFGTEPYDVWVSDNPNLGFIAVNVQ